MKKFFLLISATLITMALNAAVININTETSDALRVALNSAADGDEIVMAAGTYVESNGGYIAFTGKHVTVKAADGENVIIQPKVPVTIAEGGCAHFENVKFDVSKLTELADWYEHLIYPTDANTGNSMILDGCEIYGFTLNKSLLFCGSDYRLASVTITNCYFHNIKKSCLFIQSTEAVNILISNSTFANITTDADSYYAGVIDSRATSGSFSVDHCTFYNVQVMNTDYGTIGKANPGAIVSNCIFAMPESTAELRAIRDVATANNCLTYNYTKDSNWGIHSSVTKNNCIQLKDPLFTDAANGDFSYAGNWTTMSISPAREAATDGSDLGDPRWYTDETLPTTGFASDYVFLGTKAQLSGSFALNGDNYIQSQDKTYAGVAKWKIHAERQCIVEVTLNIADANTSGHRYEVAIYDADNVLVGTALAELENSWSHGDKVLGTYAIPAAGDYTVKLTNDCNNSSTIIEGVTFAYYGGALQNIATDANTTLNVTDVWFSGCTRDNEKTYIQYPSSSTSDAWIKWNIATSETKYYDLTVNVNTDYAHGFTIAIYEDEEAEPVASVTEGSFVNTTGDGLALELGRVNLIGGKNYVVKVTNAPSGSQAKVTSVVFAPVVATATELPGTLAFSNAVLSEKANITDGMLYFNEPDADKDPRGEWAQWEVTTDHDGLFLFTMGVTSTNEQSYKITILDNLDNVLDYYESSPGSGDKTLTHYFALNTGSYFVKVENTRSYSKGHLTSFVVTEPAGIVTIDEAATSNESWVGKVVVPEAEGPLYDVQIIRTIKAGMYNTICLPFEVTSAQAKDIFGADVQLRTLKSADLVEEGQVLDLSFEQTSGMYPGTPHLIKTSRDIVNPVFTGVKFTRTTPASTTKTNANFVGTFIKDEIPADPNNLFMGANNTLYFPTVNMPILGMRAYFVIHDVPAGAVKRARIIENEQVATEIELIMEQPNANSQKLIINGQLIIIRDGVRYNAMGVKLQ